jgi:ADP-ribosylglycohydrolase
MSEPNLDSPTPLELTPARRDRARAALLGLAVGDALGTTLEFTKPAAPPFPTLARGPHRECVGGGPFGVAPGQVTDDTQMACCLAASLADRGALDLDDVARRYVEWEQHAFDIGHQTRAAIARLRAGDPSRAAGAHVWRGSERRPAGNGSLMRTAPIGVRFAGDPDAAARAGAAESSVTHFDPRCRLACAAFDAVIATAVLAPTSMDAFAVARRALDLVAADLERDEPEDAREVADARDALRRDLDAAERDDPDLYGAELHLHRVQGFVRVAFRLAFWELSHAPSLEAALVDVVNRGGDADTNGAITGALLGAVHGASAIPERWTRAVLGALEHDPPGPLRDALHPRALVALAEPLAAAGLRDARKP